MDAAATVQNKVVVDADPLTAAGLSALLADYERIGRELFADGIWTCNGGAVFLKYLCDRAGLEAELCVGLYWWPAERLREKYEALEGGTASDEELADYWRDEHHHWVVVTDSRLPEPLLLDPNGECRLEPRVQPYHPFGTEENERYQADDRESKWSGIDSQTDPLAVAGWDKDVARAIQAVAGREAGL